MELDTTKVANAYMRAMEEQIADLTNQKNLLVAQLNVAAADYDALAQEISELKDRLKPSEIAANTEARKVIEINRCAGCDGSCTVCCDCLNPEYCLSSGCDRAWQKAKSHR